MNLLSASPGEDMDATHFYEATVGDLTLNYAFRFLTIPQSLLSPIIYQGAYPPGYVLASVFEVTEFRKIRPSELPRLLMNMLYLDDIDNTEQRATMIDYYLYRDIREKYQHPFAQELEEFAEYIAFANLVPFEESPINLVSLASKAASYATSPVMLGAFIGVVAGGLTPLLLLTVPTGIIVCATAKAFADVVDKRRDEIIGSLIGLNPKEKKGSAMPVPPSTPLVITELLPPSINAQPVRKRAKKRQG